MSEVRVLHHDVPPGDVTCPGQPIGADGRVVTLCIRCRRLSDGAQGGIEPAAARGPAGAYECHNRIAPFAHLMVRGQRVAATFS